MRNKSLTDVAARNAQARDKPYKLAAGGGLYLEVMPNGARYWRLKYRFAGREKRLAIGVYPEVRLREAMVERDKARLLLRAGKDPSAVKRAAKAHSLAAAGNTFQSVASEWLQVRQQGWTERQLVKERARLANHAWPWIGKEPISEIGIGHVKPLLSRIAARGHVDQAHRLQQQLSRIFRFAIATGRAERDPAADLRDTLPTHTQKNLPHITDPVKVGELLRAMDAFSGTFVVWSALQLAALCFVRPGELRAAEWSEVDLDTGTWSIGPERRKLKKAQKEDPHTPPHIVPLSTQAIKILVDLSAVTGGGKFVFPGARGPSRCISENTINAALRRMGYEKTSMTGHGFRHMASTMLNEHGTWSKDAIERQLSHKEPGISGVYNKAERLPERRMMMQSWADYLDVLRSGNAVPFNRRRAA